MTSEAATVDGVKSETFTERLLELEEKQRVMPSDPKVKRVEDGAVQIMTAILENVAVLDNRFRSKLIKSGSYYDGVKVGQPDEFDFMAEVVELSESGICQFQPTTDPGFVNLILLKEHERWSDCRGQICHHNKRKRECRQCKDSEDEDSGSKKDDNTVIEIIAPEKAQHLFRELVNKVVFSHDFQLPEGWEHGGLNRPQFSGVRKHGPAVLLQFVVLNYEQGKELKVTLDISLCVKVSQPIDCEEFGFLPLRLLPPEHPTHKLIKEGLMSDDKAGLHVIPLYSKMLVTSQR
jgi:hypothetical protein